jgi:hypothetical protein
MHGAIACSQTLSEGNPLVCPFPSNRHPTMSSQLDPSHCQPKSFVQLGVAGVWDVSHASHIGGPQSAVVGVV